MLAVIAISLGAALGALLRWVLGNQLNALFPMLPPGTLTANLLGGYLIGLAVAFFASHPTLPPEWRLLVVTGFLGGLTTFSTFSAEVVTQLMAGRLGWSLMTVLVHVAGSITMTLLGIGTVGLIRHLRFAGA
ncbi:fluoride efflux transporter CrcB [Ideonella sp. B7]|uniref:fluoride efflux transporter CrcB n=1 Tax=Ideonella benzenivorans TaxID=2831643 RepID=UPI001CED2945|nr:fluoride efflux transporter CrcB [Ideonella benzenivorans]MCA6215842.1 fluoride efflux transporter CrcB [Ideonella benzenivorans]